jgi:penicillin-binding protein 2
MQAFLEGLLEGKGASAAMVMDVRDGAIIAAASHPSFDPNEFATGISRASMNYLFNADSKPMFNRLSQARYPPASTFKIVSTFAILNSRLVNPGEILVYCTGGHQFGNRYFRCWQAGGHGAMNLMNAVIQSCDVYFYKVAEIMDVDILAEAARDFGFGRKTGIDLPGEVQGLVPDRDYYDTRFGKGRWTQGYVLNNIIGQGEYLVNVIQVARMCAAIANGGALVTPHLVDHIEGEPPVAYSRRKVRELDGNKLRFLQRAMERVVSDPDGTAQWTRIPWLTTAGKTGTAENPHGAPHAWYTAYAPADEPEIAIVVLVENAGHGGEVAAPIVRDFFIEYYGPQVTARPGTPALEGKALQVSPPAPEASLRAATEEPVLDIPEVIPLEVSPLPAREGRKPRKESDEDSEQEGGSP